MPMTPQAMRPPALPVGWPPSSSLAWTMMERPTTGWEHLKNGFQVSGLLQAYSAIFFAAARTLSAGLATSGSGRRMQSRTGRCGMTTGSP